MSGRRAKESFEKVALADEEQRPRAVRKRERRGVFAAEQAGVRRQRVDAQVEHVDTSSPVIDAGRRDVASALEKRHGRPGDDRAKARIAELARSSAASRLTIANAVLRYMETAPFARCPAKAAGGGGGWPLVVGRGR